MLLTPSYFPEQY